MTPEEWSEVDAAVSSALALGAGEREEFLARRLAGREHLIAEARSLLSYDDDSQPDPVAVDAADQWVGRRVGAYRITEKAGEGGMGVVWSALRDDGQFERRVAVKFLSGLAPSGDTLDRFLKERGILARLDHPHIARLLDAGFEASPAGDRRPYLVLEWVDGARIDEYVRQWRLGTREVLRLFRQVCGAVGYAHRQLVVHRDLKPANIFVTAEGEAKLLDFGIAKMLDGARVGDAAALFTSGLTPEYASPEQLRGEPAGTADDVYSLGVVLRELLTGQRWAQQGGTGKRLGPELDAMVRKATAAEAEQRYGSVAELAAEIDSFLAGRPVAAAPGGALYRARKFVRRHWAGVLATAAAAALICGAAIVAVRQRRVAEQRFAQLRQLAKAVIFEFQGDISSLPGALEARQKMVKRSLTYLDSLAADAHNDPQLLMELAQGYEQLAKAQGLPSVANLGDFAGALATIGKAHATLDRLVALQPDNVDAACELGDVLFTTANIQERVPNQDAAATRRQGIRHWENLASRHPDNERVTRGLAAALFYQQDYERSLTLYEQLAARSPKSTRDYPHDIALLCRMIATRAGQGGDLDRMRRLAERAVDLDRKRVEAQPLSRGARLDLSFDLGVLADWHTDTNDSAGAIRLQGEVVKIREELVRLDPRDEQAKDRLFYASFVMGKVCQMGGDPAEAGRWYRRAVELGEEQQRTGAKPNTQFKSVLQGAKERLAQVSGKR